ncbi:hypothetical protein CEXT_89511 [Caerostris extrusa]|nr:hypothetical protein CEXT_89511 [Caerostris extrusa]
MLSEPKKRSPCSKSSSIHEGKFLRSKIVSKPEDKSPDDKISFLPNEAFPCDYCEFEADSIRNLRQHGLIHSILYHMCGNSGKFYLKSDLFSHLEAEHPHIAYCYCDLCGREFTSVTAKMCHRRTCMQEELFTCKQCHKIFYDIIAFKQHERTHEN